MLLRGFRANHARCYMLYCYLMLLAGSVLGYRGAQAASSILLVATLLTLTTVQNTEASKFFL
jgi:hypothetical protein